MTLREDDYNQLIDYESSNEDSITNKFNIIYMVLHLLFVTILLLGFYVGFSYMQGETSSLPQTQVTTISMSDASV